MQFNVMASKGSEIFLNRVSAEIVGIQLFDGKAMVEQEVHCERECEYRHDRIANRVEHLTFNLVRNHTSTLVNCLDPLANTGKLFVERTDKHTTSICIK
jgi:hypothetical protein